MNVEEGTRRRTHDKKVMFARRSAPVLLAAFVLSIAPARGESPAIFTDDACPAATPLGRRLNEINARAKPSNDELIATAKGMVGAYRDCVDSFDRDARGHQYDQSSDFVVVHRMYVRLALARALQRVGSYAGQLDDAPTARADYDDALKRLEEVEVIGSAAAGSKGAEGKLLASARGLHDELFAAEKALPPSKAPAASSSPL